MKNLKNKPQPMLSNIKDYKEANLWLRGRQEMKAFYAIELKKMTNFKTFVFGLLMAVMLIFPFALVLFQYIRVYQWNPDSFKLFLAFAWAMIMFMNGLSNLFTVKFAKKYASDLINLQTIDEYSILFYQTLNPGFGLFVLALFLLFGAGILGGF